MYIMTPSSHNITSWSNIRLIMFCIVITLMCIGIYKHLKLNKKYKKEGFQTQLKFSIMDLKEFDSISADVKKLYENVFVDEVFPHLVQRIKDVLKNTEELKMENWVTVINDNEQSLKNIATFLKEKIDLMIPTNSEIPSTWLEVIMNSIPSSVYNKISSSDSLTNSSDDVMTNLIHGVKNVLPGNLSEYSFDSIQI